MVDLHIGQINAIGYYKKLANDAWIKNMQLFHVNNALIGKYEIKNVGDPWMTYNALGSLKTHGCDWFRLWRWPGRD